VPGYGRSGSAQGQGPSKATVIDDCERPPLFCYTILLATKPRLAWLTRAFASRAVHQAARSRRARIPSFFHQFSLSVRSRPAADGEQHPSAFSLCTTRHSLLFTGYEANGIPLPVFYPSAFLSPLTAGTWERERGSSGGREGRSSRPDAGRIGFTNERRPGEASRAVPEQSCPNCQRPVPPQSVRRSASVVMLPPWSPPSSLSSSPSAASPRPQLPPLIFPSGYGVGDDGRHHAYVEDANYRQSEWLRRLLND
jgi:hypothetical protein